MCCRARIEQSALKHSLSMWRQRCQQRHNQEATAVALWQWKRRLGVVQAWHLQFLPRARAKKERALQHADKVMTCGAALIILTVSVLAQSHALLLTVARLLRPSYFPACCGLNQVICALYSGVSG